MFVAVCFSTHKTKYKQKEKKTEVQFKPPSFSRISAICQYMLINGLNHAYIFSEFFFLCNSVQADLVCFLRSLISKGAKRFDHATNGRLNLLLLG